MFQTTNQRVIKNTAMEAMAHMAHVNDDLLSETSIYKGLPPSEAAVVSFRGRRRCSLAGAKW